MVRVTEQGISGSQVYERRKNTSDLDSLSSRSRVVTGGLLFLGRGEGFRSDEGHLLIVLKAIKTNFDQATYYHRLSVRCSAPDHKTAPAVLPDLGN